MKKVFAILAIAGFMVACNNKSEKKEEIKDSSDVIMDTTNKMMDTTTIMVDTTKM